MQAAIAEAVRNLVNNPDTYWDGDRLNWDDLSDTGILFNVPDGTPDDTSDNKRGAILSVTKNSDGTWTAETTRGIFNI